jgi:hypothetical protein
LEDFFAQHVPAKWLNLKPPNGGVDAAAANISSLVTRHLSLLFGRRSGPTICWAAHQTDRFGFRLVVLLEILLSNLSPSFSDRRWTFSIKAAA